MLGSACGPESLQESSSKHDLEGYEHFEALKELDRLPVAYHLFSSGSYPCKMAAPKAYFWEMTLKITTIKLSLLDFDATPNCGQFA